MTTKDEAIQKAITAMKGVWAVGLTGSNASSFEAAMNSLEEALENHDDTDPNAPWLTEAHLLCTDHGVEHGHITDRIRKLREALAEQQEPVAILHVGESLHGINAIVWDHNFKQGGAYPVYTSPPQHNPLTEEVIRLATVALHEMPHPATDWHEAAKRVCQAVVAHGISEQL